MDESSKMNEIAMPWTTVADRIRALHSAGYERAAIAKHLGKRYQHVRNVLVEDERRQATSAGVRVDAWSGVSEPLPQPWRRDDAGGSPSEAKAYLRLQITAEGAIRLPAELEKALGFQLGGVVIARLLDDRLELLSTREALRRAREMARDLSSSDEGMAESLIADRRREAVAEAEG